MKPLAERKIQ